MVMDSFEVMLAMEESSDCHLNWFLMRRFHWDNCSTLSLLIWRTFSDSFEIRSVNSVVNRSIEVKGMTRHRSRLFVELTRERERNDDEFTLSVFLFLYL